MEVIASLTPPRPSPTFGPLASSSFPPPLANRRPRSLSPQFAEVALKNGLKPFLGKNRFDEFPQQ